VYAARTSRCDCDSASPSTLAFLTFPFAPFQFKERIREMNAVTTKTAANASASAASFTSN
jgi:hypothetical protein